MALPAHRADVAAVPPADRRSSKHVAKQEPHHFRLGITHVLATCPASSVQRAPRPLGRCHPAHAGIDT
jgi:hypothetical protein